MYQRYIANPIIEALKDTPVILINGARQTGKSTLCRQLVEEGTFDGQILTMDDPTTLTAAQADPLGFLQDLSPHAIIDEIQRAPGLFLSIKKLVDENRKGRRLILTGSADVMTLPQVADSLAGRIESFAPASGSQFSLLPAENATGNFTKIVQRVPVRIALPEGGPLAGLLRPGLSVVVSVDTRTGPAPAAEGLAAAAAP